jgi:hypothetical protein
MRTLQNALLAGVAALAIGFSGAALAQTSNIHTMTVRLPGGGVAQIRYAGDVAPQVRVSEAPGPVAALMPMPVLFGPDSPFATLDRISAEIDRQAAAMFRQSDALLAAARSGQLTPVTLRNLAPGTQSYSFVASVNGGNVCSRSVEITAPGNGAAPRVVSHSSGNCGPAEASGGINLPTASPPAGQPGPVWTGAPAPAARPDVVWTSASGAKPYKGLVREIPPAQR